MHQQPADRVMAEPAGLVLAAVDALGEADQLRLFPLVGELGRVLQDQDRPAGRSHALTRRLEMALENSVFANPCVGKEPVGGFGVCPVLAGPGNGLAHRAAHLIENLVQPPVQALIGKLPLGDLVVHPACRAPIYACVGNSPLRSLAGHRRPGRDSEPGTESQPIQRPQGLMPCRRRPTPNLWVIESRRGPP